MLLQPPRGRSPVGTSTPAAPQHPLHSPWAPPSEWLFPGKGDMKPQHLQPATHEPRADPGTSSTPSHFGENPPGVGLSWASIFPCCFKHQNLGMSPLSRGLRMGSPGAPLPCQPQGCSTPFSRALAPFRLTPAGESREHPPRPRHRAGPGPAQSMACRTPRALGGTSCPTHPCGCHVPPQRVTGPGHRQRLAGSVLPRATATRHGQRVSPPGTELMDTAAAGTGQDRAGQDRPPLPCGVLLGRGLGQGQGLAASGAALEGAAVVSALPWGT